MLIQKKAKEAEIAMPKPFRDKFKERSKGKLNDRGYRYSHTNHRGQIYVVIRDDILYRACVEHGGIVRHFKPRKPTTQEMMMYRKLSSSEAA